MLFDQLSQRYALVLSLPFFTAPGALRKKPGAGGCTRPWVRV
jgi:hypothetical protein